MKEAGPALRRIKADLPALAPFVTESEAWSLTTMLDRIESRLPASRWCAGSYARIVGRDGGLAECPVCGAGIGLIGSGMLARHGAKR